MPLGARLNGKLLNYGAYVMLHRWPAFPWYSFRTFSLQYVGARSLSTCWALGSNAATEDKESEPKKAIFGKT